MGIEILKELFKLSHIELRAKLQDICGDKIKDPDIFEKGHVHKTVDNDEPEHIKIYYYDCLSVSPFGITFEPEHGESRSIVEFNKYFKL